MTALCSLAPISLFSSYGHSLVCLSFLDSPWFFFFTFYTHTHTHTHTHTLSVSRLHTHTHRSVSLLHTHTHSVCLSLTHTHTLSVSLLHTHTHTLSVSLLHTHTHSVCLSLPHTHTLCLSLSYTHTHTLSVSLLHTHTRSRTSRTPPHTRTHARTHARTLLLLYNSQPRPIFHSPNYYLFFSILGSILLLTILQFYAYLTFHSLHIHLITLQIILSYRVRFRHSQYSTSYL